MNNTHPMTTLLILTLTTVFISGCISKNHIAGIDLTTVEQLASEPCPIINGTYERTASTVLESRGDEPYSHANLPVQDWGSILSEMTYLKNEQSLQNAPVKIELFDKQIPKLAFTFTKTDASSHPAVIHLPRNQEEDDYFFQKDQSLCNGQRFIFTQQYHYMLSGEVLITGHRALVLEPKENALHLSVLYYKHSSPVFPFPNSSRTYKGSYIFQPAPTP